MPEITSDGCRIWFTTDGPVDAPLLLLSNSLGTTTELWEPQLPVLAREFHVVRYDTRGHGRSETPPGDYTLDQLGRDALAVLGAAGASSERRAHVCGISLGGMTAMWLAVHAPDMVGRVVLADTAARIGTRELWEARLREVRERGMAAIADGSMARWFTAAFTERHPATVERFRAMVAGCPVDAYLGCGAALRDADLREDVQGIGAPTLVVVGVHDLSTTPVDADDLCRRISGARLITLDAAHLSNIEQATTFTSAAIEFFCST